MPISQKWLIIEGNGGKFGTLRVVVTCVGGTFDLLVFKVNFGSFGAFV